MEPIISKQQAQEYRARWDAVAAIELEEQRAASVSQRWQQLNDIFRMGLALGLPLESEAREQEITGVRQRWLKLKEGLA